MARPRDWHAARPLVAEARTRLWQRRRRDPNVVAIGFGAPTRGGERLDTPACVISVVRKLPLEELSGDQAIPRTVEVQGTQIETDVVETGHYHAFEFADRERPALEGISIGHKDITAGTLGCLVVDLAQGGKRSILSNNHVLANSNRGIPGDAIYQPGPIDAPKVPENVIAKLTRFIPVAFDGTANRVDCAVAAINGECDVYDAVRGGRMGSPSPAQPAVGLLFAGSLIDTVLNPINEVAARLQVEMTGGAGARSAVTADDVVSPGAPVQKTGRTSEYTTGRIWQIDVSIKVNYDGRIASYDGQIITSPMSGGGDSGSVVCRGGTGAVNLVPFLILCPFIGLAEEMTGIPFTQEWVSIKFTRDKYLATTLVGRWLIDALYLNQERVILRGMDTASTVPAEDQAFAQALYTTYSGDVKLALLNPDRTDVRVTDQFMLDVDESLSRARKFLIDVEANAVQQAIQLARDKGVVGKNGRDLLTLLDDSDLLDKLKQIAASTGSLKDPDAVA
jgi:hypothetical protein